MAYAGRYNDKGLRDKSGCSAEIAGLGSQEDVDILPWKDEGGLETILSHSCWGNHSYFDFVFLYLPCYSLDEKKWGKVKRRPIHQFIRNASKMD